MARYVCRKKVNNKLNFHIKKALHVACDYGYASSVTLLLKYNANPNEIDASEQNALHIACKHGNPELVSLLVAHSASVTAKTFQGIYFQNNHTTI